ncbi:MAG: hypothetical protein CSA32_03770 [Desulfobulbus propionicus]|nr:MAG: hypothetical protein CSA32_03770 [Desulfobulbus propionicus]
MSSDIKSKIKDLYAGAFAPADFLPGTNLAEKVTSLMLEEVACSRTEKVSLYLRGVHEYISSFDFQNTRVVAFGGGTGLSTIIGGDSRKPGWRDRPFSGLKKYFAELSSIVCTTDDGGSTGELLKDLPLIALGDLRHVLLSAVRKQTLIRRYQLGAEEACEVAGILYDLFNYRFPAPPESAGEVIQESGARVMNLPSELGRFLEGLIRRLFDDKRLNPVLQRKHCLGNLLLASAVYEQLDENLSEDDLLASPRIMGTATLKGLGKLTSMIGASPDSVLPCTTTMSQLQVLYDNGVLVSSEYKSGQAQRGYPVDRIFIDFSCQPFLPPEVVEVISSADIIVFAPGSLYTSIIPILQIPEIAEVVRRNRSALKVLVANIWVQKGETDVTRDSPERKFHVSDLIRAYHRNIPGGIHSLFSHVLCLKMRDIPGSILQRYALEDKEPIYVDREEIESMGLRPIIARIYSEALLRDNGIIQHDPDAIAGAIKTLWVLKNTDSLTETVTPKLEMHPSTFVQRESCPQMIIPCMRFKYIQRMLNSLSLEIIGEQTAVSAAAQKKRQDTLFERLAGIIWQHPDIQIEHLRYIRGFSLIVPERWKRCQQWDNVFSFYDPVDRKIKIRLDQTDQDKRFEAVFLVALGQSLLGNYALSKKMTDVFHDGERVGQVYQLTIQEKHLLKSFLSIEDITAYLQLCKMTLSANVERLYYRVINGKDGFTPPGLFFGLFYAWYLDNRFAPNIDYKMSIMMHDLSDLIPEQIRILAKRKAMIAFFRKRVFLQNLL